MRLENHRLIKPFALIATAMIAMAVALTFGAGVGLAADKEGVEDAKNNVCEGGFTAAGCPKVTGENNVALGNAMMPVLTSGSNNVALDFGALAADTTGGNNIASGTSALEANTTASDNVATGVDALEFNTTGEYNVANGAGALEENTIGSRNIASGFLALNETTNGSNNVASGHEALRRNKKGNDNVASGFHALLANTEGSGNVASGSSALTANITGSYNVASGVQALDSNIEGSYNVAIGLNALDFNIAANNNVASGHEALENTTGAENVGLGFRAGKALTAGTKNIDISNEGVAAEERTTRIGTENVKARAFMAGIWGKPAAAPLEAVMVDKNGQLVTVVGSSARYKQEVHGLGASAAERVLQLRPVSYRYKPAYAQGNDKLQYGLIAEQVARLFPALVQYGPDGKPDGVHYEQLPVLLLTQLQREHTQVSHQQHEIDQLASELQSLRREMRAHR